MHLEYFTSRMEAKALNEDGAFEGYGAVFENVDRGGDIIKKGAFRESLSQHKKQKTKPLFLLNHDSDQVAGVIDEIKEDNRGLFVTGRFNLEKQAARETYSDIRMGASKGMSIGYIARKVTRDEQTGVRTISALDLWEVSSVAFPMNERAEFLGVKSIANQISTVREFESFLRDVGGFSAGRAKKYAARGFCDRSPNPRDAGGDLTQALAGLLSVMNQK